MKIVGVNNKKTILHWGIRLTGIEMMDFAKYINNNNIAPNTMLKKERITLLKNWLENKKTR